MSVLEGLEPEKVFYYFEEISKIPRGSENERAVADYCVNFAKERDLWVYRDQLENVLIKKDATNNGADPIILQGHLDMVCEKNAGCGHDFLKDEIKLQIDGDNIKADKTTLGADNGIAVAMMLAVLDDDNLKHPPLECLFTSQEEVGLKGAANFDYSKIQGKRLINLDTEKFGKLMVSCAGGLKTDIELPIEWMDSQLENSETYAIRIRGLKGGHSGADIHLERANANKLLGRVLDYLKGKIDYEICTLSGGAKDNAIPRESQAYINIKEPCKLEELIEAFESQIINEYKGKENGISIKATKEEKTGKVFTKAIATKAIGIIMLTPNGVISTSYDIDGLVETSNNLGVITMEENSVVFSCAVRSALETGKQYVGAVIQNVAELCEAKFEATANYPGWQYNPESKLRMKAEEAYKALTGMDVKLEAIHAGLECGIFSEAIKGCDIVSFGPDMWDAHTPEERISIKSIKDTYELLVKILEIS